MSAVTGWPSVRAALACLFAAMSLAAGCTTHTPETAAQPGGNPPAGAPGPTDQAPGAGVSGGPGTEPANAEDLARAARSDPEVGDPLEPDLPAISAEVVAYLNGDGRILVDFVRSTEGLVAGQDECETVVVSLDDQGLSPPLLYDAASGVPDTTLSSAFINDIAEKLRHVEGCDRAAHISFTHTVVARILATVGLL